MTNQNMKEKKKEKKKGHASSNPNQTCSDLLRLGVRLDLPDGRGGPVIPQV